MSAAIVTPPLVVGIDGSESALVALDWAAEEAARNGWPLRLVNAAEQYAIEVTTRLTGREAAEAMFAEARERLAARGHGDLEVATVSRYGAPRRVLLHESADARALVVGREGIGRFEELLLGSTSLALTTHADVPVIVIPEGWRPSPRERRVITVGVDGSERAQHALEYAFMTASAWKADVVAVFAIDRPSPVLGETQPVDAEGKAEATRTLAEQVAGWRAKYPDIKVTEVVEMGHPAAVIKENSADADLVVIGGRGHGVVTGMLLGSIARAVLHHVTRPIVVVHEPKSRRS